jgi:hypothetical protein
MMLLSLAQTFLRRVTSFLRFVMSAGHAPGNEDSGSGATMQQAFPERQDDDLSALLRDPLSVPNEMLRSRESRCDHFDAMP